MNLKFLFGSGKNAKLPYYIRNYSKVILPKFVFQSRLKSKLKSISSRPDGDYILSRVNYYNKLETVKELPESSKQFSDLKKEKKFHLSIFWMLMLRPVSLQNIFI